MEDIAANKTKEILSDSGGGDFCWKSQRPDSHQNYKFSHYGLLNYPASGFEEFQVWDNTPPLTNPNWPDYRKIILKYNI